MATKGFNQQLLELDLLTTAATRERWLTAWELIAETWKKCPRGDKPEFNSRALLSIRRLQASKKLLARGSVVMISPSIKDLF